MNTPKIEVHQYDGVKSSLHTGKLLPGERGYAGGESATPRTDDAFALKEIEELALAIRRNLHEDAAPAIQDDKWVITAAAHALCILDNTATLRAQIARLKQREGELETLIQRMLDAARGSLDYSGGHRDKDLENFHHGIQTVIRVLEAVAKSDPGDTQVNALVRIGRSAALQSVAKEGETKSL